MMYLTTCIMMSRSIHYCLTAAFCCLAACTPAEEQPLAEIPATPLMVKLPDGLLQRAERRPISRYEITQEQWELEFKLQVRKVE